MQIENAAQPLNKLLYPVARLMNSIGGIVMALMMFLTAADVILRAFRSPIPSATELTEIMMSIVIIFGLAYVTVRREHIRIDFLISRFSTRAQSVFDTITSFLAIIILALIAWQMFSYGLSLKEGGDITAVLHIPLFPVVWLAAIGMAVYTLSSIPEFVGNLSVMAGKGRLGLRSGLIILALVVVIVVFIPLWGKSFLEITPISAGIIGIVAMLVLLFAGFNIGLTMALIGFLGMAYVNGLNPGLAMVGHSPFSTVYSYSFSVIPMFMLMGAFCAASGLIKDFYVSMNTWLGRLPGGLAMATIAGCAGFAAVCGSSTATTATLGTVALPEMRKYRYDSALAAGTIAAGGCIGVMIPPSTIFIIYGILTEQSIGKLFLAGFIPGITEAIFYAVTIYILCKRNPQLGPPSAQTFTMLQKISSLRGTWAVFFLFALVIGGLYTGLFTPTEAAGAGAFMAFVIALLRRSLNWKKFHASIADTTKNVAMCFIILIGTFVFNYLLAISRLPYELSNFVSGLAVNRYIILIIILIIYLFLGCIMSGIAMVILTIPIFFPVISALGFDPIWFGVIVTRMTEIGQITPPVGINVFVIQGIARDIPMYTIFRGIIPFLISDFIHVALLVAFPQISLLIPNLMHG